LNVPIRLHLLLGLPLAVLAQAPTQPANQAAKSPSVEKQILDLRAKKDWAGIRDLIDTLPPGEREKWLTTQVEVLNRLQDWERLIPVADETLALAEKTTGPRSSMLRLVRANALANAGRHIEASKAHLEHAVLGWKPGFRSACEEARTASDLPLFLASAEAGLALFPGDLDLLGLKGEAQTKMTHFQEGAATLAEVASKGSIDASVWLNLSCCQNELATYPDAETSASQVIKLEPKNLGGYYNRARARLGLKRYAESREDFAAALALEPKSQPLRENIQFNITGIDKLLAAPAPAKAKPGKPTS